MKDHSYRTRLAWTGSTAAGYRHYDRAHTVEMGDAGEIAMSADPAFRGDVALANPEQLLLAAASSCQLLSFLSVAARAGVDVVGYTDTARAVMPFGAVPMRITAITLRIAVTVRGSDEAAVRRMLDEAHEQCFIANSLTSTIALEVDVEVVA